MSFYRKSFEIVGYTYEGGVHCVECTCKYVVAKYPKTTVEHDDYLGFGNWGARPDYSFVTESFEDSEGNEIHPVFLDDIGETEFCSDCSEAIE
jgi:hypothetical protein